MFRRLRLPYGALVELWEANLGYFSSHSSGRRELFFGKSRGGVPDFIAGRVAEARYFGSYRDIGGRSELVDTRAALERIESSAARVIAEEIIERYGVGRFYDDQGRVYLRGYGGTTAGDLAEQWFVRLPKLARDAWRSADGTTPQFPVLGEVLHLTTGPRGSSSSTLVVRGVDSEGGGRVATRSLRLEQILV